MSLILVFINLVKATVFHLIRFLYVCVWFVTSLEIFTFFVCRTLFIFNIFRCYFRGFFLSICGIVFLWGGGVVVMDVLSLRLMRRTNELLAYSRNQMKIRLTFGMQYIFGSKSCTIRYLNRKSFYSLKSSFSLTRHILCVYFSLSPSLSLLFSMAENELTNANSVWGHSVH